MEKLIFLVASIVLSVVIVATRNMWTKQHVLKYGFVGVFLVNLLGNATLFFPAPSLAATFVAGSKLDPFSVGAVSAAGATIGESTGYMAGYGGQEFVSSRPMYQTIERWMARSGFWTLFLVAVMPNPFFDVAGTISGMMNYPYWKFLTAVFLGKLVKCTVLAFLGRHVLR